jgi:mitochondrial fission protein ELM1
VTSQLAVASRAWISEDSVSMVYEALTAGATVGILEVPRKRRGRVVEGMDRLCQARRAVRWTDWVAGAPMPVPIPLAEADRAAQEILGRWFPERLTMDAA